MAMVRGSERMVARVVTATTLTVVGECDGR